LTSGGVLRTRHAEDFYIKSVLKNHSKKPLKKLFSKTCLTLCDLTPTLIFIKQIQLLSNGDKMDF
jgi:hypothetical protein